MNEQIQESNDFSNEEERSLTILQRTIGVFTSPRETFADIARRPTWIFPLIFTIIAAMLITQLLVPAILADTKANPKFQELMQREDMTPEQRENLQNIQIKSIQNFSAVGAGVTLAIASAVAAAILLFVGNILFGGTATYRQLFSAYCWSGLIGTLGYLIRLPLSLSKMTMKIYFSPAVFFPENAEHTALFKAAASLDAFMIWRIVLLAIAFAVIYKFSFGKSLTIIGGMFVLQIAATIVFSGMF